MHIFFTSVRTTGQSCVRGGQKKTGNVAVTGLFIQREPVTYSESSGFVVVALEEKR
ncbi:hypothetical protein SAMN04488540_10582 [Ferrimonas sediminum]|uniref:Uncharacterized protein n=1 Tax=Ferrimonas sediminum TaxID=718193 RepID=A0A1G8R6Y8_9GAMM|nr:hypothetical protein SAMN04488540_10582 [Ferrimonas sediminum]